MTNPDPAPTLSSSVAADLFAGAWEMRAPCRHPDRGATPLVPAEGWPAELRWAVRTCLGSPFPINLWCGPRSGERVPGPEVWSEMGPGTSTP